MFERDAWKPLEEELGSKVKPKQFIDSMIEKCFNEKAEIAGIVGFDAANKSLLKVTETIAQNRHFQSMKEWEKVWTIANSGETQSWTQT